MTTDSIRVWLLTSHSLAYAEMRLILANMIYNFDLTLADESKDWIAKQKAYPLWARGPLQVFVEPVFGQMGRQAV